MLYLAQEAVLHSPYQRGWLGDVAAGGSGLARSQIGARLDAEAAMRFGADAVYDGSTQALADESAGRFDRADLADQLLRHSMFVGAEPSPIGITAWSQPWVPTWLEWEAELDADRHDAGLAARRRRPRSRSRRHRRPDDDHGHRPIAPHDRRGPHARRRGAGLPRRRGCAGEGDRRRRRRARRRRDGAGHAGRARSSSSTW